MVHYGSGMHYGHYWSLARSKGNSSLDGSQTYKWVEFDDSKIRIVEDKEIQLYYGSPAASEGNQTANQSWHSAYMLLYESQDLISCH